jgi:uncharacterized protein with NRDE domain
VCLLVALSGVLPDAPLIMAANRDERYGRPAVAMTTLRHAGPRVLGGRDELAGGTWLAVNEHGVVAGLTNQPSAGGRDTTRRTRGEIPLAFAAYRSAAEAVSAVCATLDPSAYNACWLLVGDQETLFFVEVAGGVRPQAEELGPGLHVLENAPLRARSAKAEQVAMLVAAERAARASVAAPGAGPGPGEAPDTVADALAAVLRDHRPVPDWPVPGRPVPGPPVPGRPVPGRPVPGRPVPGRPVPGRPVPGPPVPGRPVPDPPDWPVPSKPGLARSGVAAAGPDGRPWPAAISAACVHTLEYGTRSSLIVTVPAAGVPRLRVADGPPCQAPLRDVTGLWTGSALV